MLPGYKPHHRGNILRNVYRKRLTEISFENQQKYLEKTNRIMFTEITTKSMSENKPP